MIPRLGLLILSVGLLSLACLSGGAVCRGAEPDLKAGVRLSLRGSRLQGWAAPEVVDWNNDGLNDVVVGHYSGTLSVYLNRGFGKNGLEFDRLDVERADDLGNNGKPIWAWRFNKANCVCPGPGRISPRVMDWDGDGKKDLVIGDGVGAQIRIWRNVGSDDAPVYSTHDIEYLPPDAGVRPYHETVQPCIVDWNRDGKRDLLMGRNRGLYLYLNKGTDLAPQFDFDRSRLGTKIGDVFPTERLCPVVVDWDADTKSDLLVGSQSGEVWFARNVGSNRAPEFKEYSPVRVDGKPINVGSDVRIAVDDLDGDGQADLLVGGVDGMVWFFQTRQSKPMARTRFERVKHNGSIAVTLVGTDDGGRALKFRLLTRPKHGALSGIAPDLTYTPEKGYQGPDEFTFKVSADALESTAATVAIRVQSPDQPPTITAQPADVLVGVGQPATFRVVATGTPPFSYEWKKNGKVVPTATGNVYVLSETKRAENATLTATVENASGSATSRTASLQVEPLPAKTADLPVISIQTKSPVIEPATPGLLTLTRTGNTSQPVTILLATRRAHDPVVADLHFVPTPSQITMKAGQTTAEVNVTPIDDSLVNGTRALTFLVVPNPAYRLATKVAAAKMEFLDDDCPHVGISVVSASASKPDGQPTFKVTAHPAPRLDTEITYFVGGTAVGGVDYETLAGTVTIPAGKTSAEIVIKPYRKSPPTIEKTVSLTLRQHRFTFFDFYEYLTEGKPTTASIAILPTDTSPPPPLAKVADADVEKMRREVSKLGWIVFTARSDGPKSDFDLFVMRPDGSRLKNITNTPTFDEHSARVSPDGKRILYRRVAKEIRVAKGNQVAKGIGVYVADRTQQDVGTRAIRSWPKNGILVMANADGSNPKPLGSDGAHSYATWGPRGRRFACLEKPEPKEQTDVKQTGSYKLVIRDTDTLRIIKEFPAAGIHSQAVWSPDGKRIVGTADSPPGEKRNGKGIEYPVGLGKIVSLEIEKSGKRTPMARLPDWSPVWATDSDADWFQGGTPEVLHSANNYGICPAYYAMLWRSGLDEKPSELVFAEYMKHVWGGCTSPDDKYAIFVVGGDAWPLQGKMSIIRLADAPIARGRSTLFHEVLTDLFPDVKEGPILDLNHIRDGFDPHWTQAEIN